MHALMRTHRRMLKEILRNNKHQMVRFFSAVFCSCLSVSLRLWRSEPLYVNTHTHAYTSAQAEASKKAEAKTERALKYNALHAFEWMDVFSVCVYFFNITSTVDSMKCVLRCLLFHLLLQFGWFQYSTHSSEWAWIYVVAFAQIAKQKRISIE